MVTFSEISPSEFPFLYAKGMSIKEIAGTSKTSYTYVRNHLVRSHAKLRSKGEGTRSYIRRHPEWRAQFAKYFVEDNKKVSHEKLRLLAMIITEGYTDASSLGFTNTQEQLHTEFTTLLESTYGKVHVGRNRITSRLSSVAIARDLERNMTGKSYTPSNMDEIVSSTELTAQILRIVADTEGSVVISAKSAPRNYTVGCAIVLASKNAKFSRQIATLLSNLNIRSHVGSVGVKITAKKEIAKFVDLVGFSPGIKVIRRKAGVSWWYGKEKRKLSELCLEIYERQGSARASGRGGCFEDCLNREDTMSRLMSWYGGSSGGE